MSDHETNDPVDKTFAQAEALLDDDAARIARRARVLDAVTHERAPQTGAPSIASRRPSGWRYAGWLTAASLIGLGALVTYQLSPIADVAPVARPEATAPESPPPPSAVNPPPTLDAAASEAPSPQVQRAPAEERAARPVQAAPPPAPQPPPPVAPPPIAAPEAAAAPPPPPPVAFPRSQNRAESAEARRATAAPVAAPAAPPPPPSAPSARLQGAVASPARLGARLRAAAAAGRTGEVAELLADGAPVDARDSYGETALMKSILANQPATAALLRRRGADPDLENRAGMSAREMAEAAANPALERALSPDR